MKRVSALLIAALLLMSLCSAAAGQVQPERPRYVFFFIGDGMGSAQITAAQYYLGTRDKAGNEKPVLASLSFPRFPVLGLMNTLDAAGLTPDSASAATSMATGRKTISGTINMGFKEGNKGPEPDKENPFMIITEYAKEAGMKIGVISSVSLDHATPAAFYAKSAKRSAYYDIAVQGLSGQVLDFLAGGGFLQPTGEDNDRKDVLEIASENGFTVLNTSEDIRAIGPDSGRVLAISPELRDSQAMEYEIDRLAGGGVNLSLAQMTAAGIRNLENNEKGFFMIVEGGKIDWACHANDAATAIWDVYALADAVSEAVAFARKHPGETLIVVTGDHETGGMSIGDTQTGNDVHMEYLLGQKLSFAAMDAVLEDMAGDQASFDDVIAAIQENYGLTREEGQPLSLTAQEIASLFAAYTSNMLPSAQREGATGDAEGLLYGGYNPLSLTASHILADRAGISFSSFTHTGISLPVYAMGAGAEQFGGCYDNTGIFSRFMRVMGLRKQPSLNIASQALSLP